MSLNTLSAILKDFYLPPVVAQLNNEILLTELLHGSSYAKISWQRNGDGLLWVPVPRGDIWERRTHEAVERLLWEQFTSTIEVPVMDTTMEKIIREHFIPVLSQHSVELRRQSITVVDPRAVEVLAPMTYSVEGFKMMCTRCGHVTKFQVPPLTMLRERTRESVESFLREIVDQHFRPWEKVQCATEGTLRTLVAEWLTHRLVDRGTLFDHELPALLNEDGYEHWDAEFVMLIAEGLDFVDDLTAYSQGKMLLLPKAHPLAPR